MVSSVLVSLHAVTNVVPLFARPPPGRGGTGALTPALRDEKCSPPSHGLKQSQAFQDGIIFLNHFLIIS